MMWFIMEKLQTGEESKLNYECCKCQKKYVRPSWMKKHSLKHGEYKIFSTWYIGETPLNMIWHTNEMVGTKKSGDVE